MSHFSAMMSFLGMRDDLTENEFIDSFPESERNRVRMALMLAKEKVDSETLNSLDSLVNDRNKINQITGHIYKRLTHD